MLDLRILRREAEDILGSVSNKPVGHRLAKMSPTEESLPPKLAASVPPRNKTFLITLSIGLLLGALLGAFFGYGTAEIEARYTGAFRPQDRWFEGKYLTSIIEHAFGGALLAFLGVTFVAAIVTYIRKDKHATKAEKPKISGRSVPLIWVVLGVTLGVVFGGVALRGGPGPVGVGAAVGGFLGWFVGMMLKDLRDWRESKKTQNTKNPGADNAS